MASESETIADIVAEIRAYGAHPPPRLMWLEIADRIEAAAKREDAKRDEVVLRLSRNGYKGMQESLSEHDRLCEMLSDSRKQVGNAAAMRDALRQIKQMGIELRNIIPHLDKNWEECLKASIRIYQTAEWALLEPPRNCDVGTPDEHQRRWRCNCGHGIPRCSKCAVYAEAKKLGLVNNRYLMISDCKFIWAQMPYSEEGGAK